MGIFSPTPILRYFDKHKYVKNMVEKGDVFFNTIAAFPDLKSEHFKDEMEGIHLFKNVKEASPEEKEKGGFVMEISRKHRKIQNAWAFCATTSPSSSAKKDYCVWVKNLYTFLQSVEKAAKLAIDQDVMVMFGPVSYYSEESDMFSKVELPMYFTKLDSKKEDLEFRIVIIPPQKFQEQESLKPLTLNIPEFSTLFEEVLILKK